MLLVRLLWKRPSTQSPAARLRRYLARRGCLRHVRGRYPRRRRFYRLMRQSCTLPPPTVKAVVCASLPVFDIANAQLPGVQRPPILGVVPLVRLKRASLQGLPTRRNPVLEPAPNRVHASFVNCALLRPLAGERSGRVSGKIAVGKGTLFDLMGCSAEALQHVARDLLGRGIHAGGAQRGSIEIIQPPTPLH